MQLTVRSREWCKYFRIQHSHRGAVLTWKKGRGRFPDELYSGAIAIINRYFAGFDVVTVPAPSFHSYANRNYPIWELAKRLRRDCGFNLQKLFPDPSGKTTKHYSGWRQKEVQEIKLKPGAFVLVIDDIVTTGNTMRITCEAIARRGGFPCGLGLA